MRAVLLALAACGGAATPPPLHESRSGPDPCAVEGACWAADDTHQPQSIDWSMELTSLLHVPKSFDTKGCMLNVAWSGSQAGTMTSGMTIISADGTAHWKEKVALAQDDLAIRVDQKIVCPNHAEFPITTRYVTGDNPQHWLCKAPVAEPGTLKIEAGHNQVTISERSNVMLRSKAGVLVDRCTGKTLLAKLPGMIAQSSVPETDDFTDGESFLAVRATGAMTGPRPEELTVPQIVFRFDHDLSAAEATALGAQLAAVAGELDIEGSHAYPRPR